MICREGGNRDTEHGGSITVWFMEDRLAQDEDQGVEAKIALSIRDQTGGFSKDGRSGPAHLCLSDEECGG